MLSRVAESVHWMSRYIERAENVARFISVNLHLNLDLPSNADEQWAPLIVTTGDSKDFKERYEDDASKANTLGFLTFDRDNPNSIFSSLKYARENARSVREIISSEMWEHINRFYLMVKDASFNAVLLDPHDFYEAVRVAGQQFTGITDNTMTHGEPWHFCQLGRSLELADKTSRILDVKYFILLPSTAEVGSPYDDIQWAALLRSASALEMYRQRHGRILPAHVVDFLVLDREFPRAVLHCLTMANNSLHAITGASLGTFSNPPEQQLGQLRSELAYTHADGIIERGLHEFVDNLQSRLNLVGNAIQDSFFAMRPVELSA